MIKLPQNLTLLHWSIKRGLFIALMLLALVTTVTLSLASSTQPSSLRSIAQHRGISIGAAVDVSPLRNELTYKQVLASEFNTMTPENAMKFQPLQPARNTYHFTNADIIVAFAKANQMQVRGHTLVWHNQLPKWLTEGKFSREELLSILRDHIQTVVSHYRGQLLSWDVVNEAIAGDGSLRETIWLRGIGPEYIEMAFRWAHEVDPQVRLFYNDYGGEGLGKKSDAIFALVRDLRQRGVPIQGVGLQMHVSTVSAPKPEDVAANIQRLHSLGLEVHITEMDVKIQNGTGTLAEKFAVQARIYRDMLRVCLSASNCRAFVMWGFTDSHSWIPWVTKKPDAPLIFDKLYHPKPAYNALREVLARE